MFIGTPSGDPRFSYPNLPIWLFRGTRWYGFPDFHGRGLKAAPFPDYNSIDMDMGGSTHEYGVVDHFPDKDSIACRKRLFYRFNFSQTVDIHSQNKPRIPAITIVSSLNFDDLNERAPKPPLWPN